MKERIKILWLPAWYPSRVDFFNGDFVHRHAIAATKFVDVILIFVVKDELLISSSTSIHFEEKDGIFIYTAYYNSSVKNLFLKKIIFGFLYFKLLFKLYGQAKKAHFNFNLIHVQIASKQGLFALWLKFTKGIKYVITEHSGWFMPIGSNFFTTSIFQKAIIKLNFKYASAIHVVSNSLGVELRKRYSFIKFFTVIPNVVDSSVFYYNNQATNKHTLQFLAINGYSFQKNVDGVIRAFSAYLQKGYNAFLHVAGPNDDHLKILAKNLDSKDTIKFYGVIDSSSIASLMQEADALLFFTRFESFGCVMAEALCCGKPVIASSLDVLKENLQEYDNALFVESENENDLTEKLIYLTDNIHKFNNKQISENAITKYNFDKIGQDFLLFYTSVLQPIK